MSKVLLPNVEAEWQKPPIHARDTSLMTRLGLLEGEVLTYLEEHGATTLRRMIRELEWPASLVMMSVGALIREGLVRGIQHELEVIIEPKREYPSTRAAQPRIAPEVWGG